jgi:hypothetical protein
VFGKLLDKQPGKKNTPTIQNVMNNQQREKFGFSKKKIGGRGLNGYE